ncbi:hypothetical protein TRVA0_021S01662 [Trichomonascus vanleenenianus]|uniref:uncharacterized protein n=1 Tax=Trichomonascus vanleenenianus TaxID=2268995 RepID=UPI003ECAF67C
MNDPLLDVLQHSVEEEDKAKFSQISQEPWSQEYLDHLRTLPQSSIANEQEYLLKSHNSNKSTLMALTQTSYKQFIDCDESIGQFKHSFSDFQAQARSFESRVRSAGPNGGIQWTGDSHGKTDSVILLKNLEKLQDILEIPSLTLACIRNGYYSEALDLASHARRLQVRFPTVEVIQKIAEDIEKHLKVMVVQLLRLLRQQNKLPTLIKVVSYLRRMAPFSAMNPEKSTEQLQQLFLVSRLAFIRSQLDVLKPLQPEKYLKSYIEVFREHVFGTVTGFRSIFPGDLNGRTKVTGQRLVSNFLRKCVDELKDTINSTAPKISDQSVRAGIWLQLVYCSQSLGRVGADFWPTVQKDCTGISTKEWNEALAKQKEIAKRLGEI